ncbi:helix-turn-helix domain-containing protein [Anaerostipes sp.]|uniref:helix-turn-helix domain-containing protein n=1 Tax=Anaerostipes sp. TaxID=1872530 RepID=UPI0025B82B01|nr:AraC family transcriptional regulator [Anaerostipes sp.]MBS7006789.1 helix-turn-helix transcriptional regulator [Anaerostipes sp.]
MEPKHPKKLIVPKQPSLVMTTSHYYKAVMTAYGISHFYAFRVEEDVHDILSIVPDGCVDFLFYCSQDHPYASIIGTRLKASPMIGKPGDYFFGVRFMPGKVLLPDTVKPDELVEGEAALMEFMKEEEVFDKIIMSRDFLAQIRNFLEFYVNYHQDALEHLDDRNLGNYLVDEITQRAGNIKIEELGELTGYSVRYVNKVFKENMGISPKTYCKIARFQTILNSLKWEEDEKDLLAIAMNAGYYDQSHMMKDFRKYTNMTPVRYVKSLEEAEYKNRLIILG